MNINSKTKICCIIGNPVGHSLSPQIHNAGYKALKLDFIFVAFRVIDLKKAIEGLKALDVRGIVVTVPHKIEVMKYIDKLDNAAKQIGSVNTIVNDNGVFKGTNTDWIGGIDALKRSLASKGDAFRGKNVAVLGAGGAAMAIAYGLKKEGASVYVFNRTLEHAKTLVQTFQLEKAYNLTESGRIASCDIIINTTSLGMEPNIDSYPIEEGILRSSHIVYDIVYTPKETKLLRMARQIGATVVYGDKMVFYGALPQFELFTGQKAPASIMERALQKAMEKKI